MPKKQQTLFERVGGKQVIAELIDEFYDRVLVDPELKPFFKDTSVDKLRRMQREFFSIAVYRTCRHLVPIANGILQSPYNNCGRGIAPYVYRGAELIQDSVDGQNQTDAVQGKACGRQYDTHSDKTGAGYYRCTDFSP